MQNPTFAECVCVCWLRKFYPDVRYSRAKLSYVKYNIELSTL